MTLANSGSDLPISTDLFGHSNSSWDVLYCPHLWENSQLRNAIVNPPQRGSTKITYCYTCRGKIRKYEIRHNREDFVPINHSTPNSKVSSSILSSSAPFEIITSGVSAPSELTQNRSRANDSANLGSNVVIPSISQQVETSSFRNKYTSYEPRTRSSGASHRRLRKSLKGIGCVVSLALADSSLKKRTQIQACSISVMIVAILVISFVLVNFTTPNFNKNVVSTKAVPTQPSDSNDTSSAMTSLVPKAIHPTTITDNSNEIPSTYSDYITIESSSQIPDFIAKLRKNVLTYLKDAKKNRTSNVSNEEKPKDINNRDLSSKFCSCQSDEVCMLDENSGTAVCRKASDTEDPTGCGGLCAMDTEACQLVDRARGVRVCRLLALVTCSPQEWRCRNGLCVDASARCDGTIHCYDRSDETYCECDLAKQFRCGHFISCFSNAKLCDGVIDCWDGFDEVNCTTECPEEQFTCTDGQCILQSRFCDGLADCADASDEPHGCDGGCGTSEYKCGNGRCVPLASRCDFQDQCGDASDEFNCTLTSTTPKT